MELCGEKQILKKLLVFLERKIDKLENFIVRGKIKWFFVNWIKKVK